MPGIRKGIARMILDFFWPPDPSDEFYKEGTAAFKQYQESHDRTALDTALARFKSCLELRRLGAKPDHPRLAVTLVNYAAAKWTYYELNGRQKPELDEVISLDNEALAIWSKVTPPPPGYPVLRNSLGKAYFDLYRLTRLDTTFNIAFKHYEEVRLHATVRPQLATVALIQMGVMLWTRSEYMKSGDRLDEGIQYLQDALLTIQDGDDNTKATCLYNLASAYEVRYQQSNKIDDLSEAIKYSQAAAPLFSDLKRAEYGPCLYNMARQRWVRFSVQRDRSDLEEARKIAVKARDEAEPDEKLKEMIASILVAMEQAGKRQGTTDSYTMY